MYTFTDLMRQAQHGQAIENFASQFGMTPNDIEKLMATMLPVYAMGMQRRMTMPNADPFGLFALMRTGPFKAAFDSYDAAVAKTTQDAGIEAMAKIFGSREAAKAIAEQAAMMTGIGTDIVNRMMPMMTSVLLGGLGKEIDKGPFVAMMEAWQKGFSGQAENKPGAASAAPFNPFTAPMDAFMKGFSAGKPEHAPEPEPEPEPELPPEPDFQNTGVAALKHMFDAGMELQETNRKAFERILETYQQRA
ncbi:hypothetical protein HDIA_0986 [Hartmannibacter diazotrophicus]|uniref:DUF937 domain-containing protein n=1 Tax=Hartmannibacter diazotrophicus TaxID=1482074 RepID=A0A2C9D2G3_9HYPH|nr:DUF937 domain-containing protein [Hartmannibacter diazotrophicus]SON54527.1 hypothetical protein HDIA_0986 [Hartmannibacter diazotrophicus]